MQAYFTPLKMLKNYIKSFAPRVCSRDLPKPRAQVVVAGPSEEEKAKRKEWAAEMRRKVCYINPRGRELFCAAAV